MQLTKADIRALQKSASAESLASYTKIVWPVLEPAEPYIHGWHIDALADHLVACHRGQMNRLLINIPPGTMKSTLTGVIFPSWLWGPAEAPHVRFIGAAHEKELAARDNRRTRLIVESEWFQDLWPTKLAADQNEKEFFENAKRGFRLSCAVTAMTGRRGHFVVWDDPINPEKANSKPELETAQRIFNETLPLRLVSPEKSSIIVIMQRLHVNDVSGHILANDFGYEHLCLPMEYEHERSKPTRIGWKDPRTQEGELLFPARFSAQVVERDKKVLGSYAAAGQYQQRPVPRGGGMFKRESFEIIPAVPSGCRWVRGWDLAASKEATSAYTAGVLMGKTPQGGYVIAHVARGRLSPAEVEAMIRNTSAQDAAAYPVSRGSIPQDPGAGGKAFAQAIVRAAAGSTVRASPETGDKITRAMPFSAQAEIGNVKLVAGPWNKDFLDELEGFPNALIKDQVDAASRAFMELQKPNANPWGMGGEPT